ncbi:MAG: AAA family ATPase [Steroidobacteraceae bacterium]
MKTRIDTRPNPFEFGTEFAPERLVDREEEVELVVRTAINRGRLFLIGPRRYGKTSILGAAEHKLEQEGIAVLRYDAETYENLGQLAEGILAQAARKLTGNLQQAGETVKRIFARLRPTVDYNFADQKISVSLGAEKYKDSEGLPLLTDVLDTVDQLAGESKRRTLIVIDEFQQVIREGGDTAERQIRSVVQRHRNTAYVFAGSKTRMLIDMTNNSDRAFWKLGSRRIVGRIPREPFLKFLRAGFEAAGMSVQDKALDRLIDLAEEVPYNVQQLAHVCWERLRTRPKSSLTNEFVDEALDALVAMENSPYTQLWTSLTSTQRTMVRAVIEERGHGLRSREVLARYAMASSTATRTLRALDERGVLREDEDGMDIRYRLEDPFLAAWLHWSQKAGH